MHAMILLNLNALEYVLIITSMWNMLTCNDAMIYVNSLVLLESLLLCLDACIANSRMRS